MVSGGVCGLMKEQKRETEWRDRKRPETKQQGGSLWEKSGKRKIHKEGRRKIEVFHWSLGLLIRSCTSCSSAGAYNVLRSNCIFPFTFITCKDASFLCFFRFLGMFDGEARSFSLFFDDTITVSSETEIFSCTLVRHNRHWFMYVLVVAVLMFFVWMWPPAFVPRPVILNKGCCNKFGGLGWLQQLFFFFGLSIACIRCVWFVC